MNVPLNNITSFPILYSNYRILIHFLLQICRFFRFHFISPHFIKQIMRIASISKNFFWGAHRKFQRANFKALFYTCVAKFELKCSFSYSLLFLFPSSNFVSKMSCRMQLVLVQRSTRIDVLFSFSVWKKKFAFKKLVLEKDRQDRIWYMLKCIFTIFL